MQHLARLCLARPRTAAALLALVTAVMGLGLPQVHPEFGYRVLVGDQHPAVQRLDGFIERFGGGLPIRIGWECGDGLPCGSVFDARSIAMAHAVTETLSVASGVSTVLGPANAALLVPAPGGFQIRRLIEHGASPADAARLSRLAVSDPLWRESLVSEDGLAASIIVQPVDSSTTTSRRVSAAVLAALEVHEQRGFRFHLTGDPIQNEIVGRDLAESTSRLVPVTVLIIALVLYLLSRSLRATGAAIATMAVALVWTFGLVGWLGWPQDGILEVLAPLVLVVGVCDAVHLLSQVAEQASARDPNLASNPEILLSAVQRVSAPCLITTLTTAAAFLSFTTSDLSTFHRFGAIAAFGSLACLGLTFSLLPLLLHFVGETPTASRDATRAWSVALEAILASAERRAVPILVASGLVIAFAATGWWLHLRIDHEWTESLGEHSSVVQSWRFMEERLGRSDTLEVEVVLPEDTALESPETLRRLRALSTRLATLESLRAPRSIVNVIERVNQLLHDDDPAARGIPDTAMANAEILELIGLDDAGLLSQWVSFDRSRVRISVGAPEQAFSTRRKVLEGLRAFARSELPASWQVVPTGRVAMQHAWIEDVQSTQLRSFPTALLLVALLLAFFLRSLWLALAAVVPTVLPIVVTLGAMGFAGVTLDVGRAMIAAILLGVGVDDAVHVLHWYRQSRSEGVPARDAIRHAIRHNGRAVVTTSVALALGFLTLMASAWQSIASFGLLAAVAILGALAASLFVLPALIFVAAKGTGRSADAPPTDSGSRARRRVVAAFLALPIAAMLALSSSLAVLDTREWVSPCWLLPRAHVVAVSGSCPLRLLDEIRWVAGPDGEPIETRSSDRVHRVLRDVGPVAHMQVIRQGRPRLVEVPLAPNTPRARAAALATAALVALGLLALPLRQVVRAPARGALPFGIYSVAIAVSLVPAIGGQHSSALDRVALVAFVSAPAALAQLAMVFPVESRIVRLAPRLQLVPWISLGLLAAVSLPALERAPVLWPAFVYLVFSLHAGLWSVLVAACLFAPREAARRAEERATWERQTTTARVATNLLQDLGKDLGWMRGLARRMERRANCDPETRGAAGEVATLASDLAQRMRSFVELARSRQHDPPDVARLDEVIERCIHDLNERCGGGRFRSTHEPGLCAVRCPYRLADSLRDRLERTLRGDLHETEDELWLRARVDGDGSLHVTLTAADGSVRASLNLAMCGWDG